MNAKRYMVLGVIFTVLLGVALQARGSLPFLDSVRAGLGLKPLVTSGEVIEKIQNASYLTTTKYTIKVVARSDDPGNPWLFKLDRKNMLLVAKGTVEAGIDLSQLDKSAVTVSDFGRSVTVNLPPVTIHNRDYSLSNRQEDTYVYRADNGFFSDTTDQETALRGQANEQLVISACKSNIMQRATSDSRRAIEQLLRKLLPNTDVTVVSGPIPTLEECIGQ